MMTKAQILKIIYSFLLFLKKENSRKKGSDIEFNNKPLVNNNKIKKAAVIAIIPAVIVYAYVRNDYKHWIDEDKDCQNTRQEVLIEESLEKVKLDEKGCKVLEGKWYDPYTDKYYEDPKILDVDHFIPLKEVHRSGGQDWDKAKKTKYANDLNDKNTLIAVYRGANRSKGAKDPSEWMPKNEEYHCKYLEIWVDIKTKWKLGMDEKEKEFILAKTKECLNNKNSNL